MLQWRPILLFLFGCVPARIMVALSTTCLPPLLVAAVLLVPAVAWVYLWGAGARLGVQAETFGAPLWWNTLRPVHAAMYVAAAAVLVLTPRRTLARGILLVDVFVGVVAHVVHHAVRHHRGD
jgi:hypothetical protein